ncbi:MAG: DUF1565 domain-containing protein [Defluviitaleaceae bacterium]|nr:DUF1565 domain-containing protein [Defluviitaleaceae bacterium]
MRVNKNTLKADKKWLILFAVVSILSVLAIIYTTWIEHNRTTAPDHNDPVNVPYTTQPAAPLDNDAAAATPTQPSTPTGPISFNTYSWYVCPTGNDMNDGSIDAPFATIQRAIFVAGRRRDEGAHTIYLREGMYFQQASVHESFYDPFGRNRPEGCEPAFLTIRNFPGEVAVLDGSLNAPSDQGGHQMIIITNSDYVRIYGLVIQNNAPLNHGFATPSAILVETAGALTGRSQGVEILNNTILGMDGDTFGMPTVNAPGANGSAIQIYGRAQTDARALRYVRVEGNEVGYCRVGWTESIVVAGNVSDFVIRHNFVHNNNNIGINVIGLWGWVTGTGNTANARLYWNRTRRGLIEGNVVINNIGYDNHASEGCGGASGIYVDGAMDMIIRYNFVSGSSVGISVGTEPYHARWYAAPVMAENIRVYHNIIANNRQGAVLMGGTFGAWDLDVRYNTMVARDIVRGSAGGVNAVVNINNNASAREMNRNFYFAYNIFVSFVDAGVNPVDPGHIIRTLTSGWNDNDADPTRVEYLTFESNVLYGRTIFGTSVETALPQSTLLGNNVRATSSPLAGMNFADGIDTGDFTQTAYANGAGADTARIQAAMADARLPLFEIAMADYRAFVAVLPAAAEIVQFLSRPEIRGSLTQPLTLDQVGRNMARYFENAVLHMPVTEHVPADSPQRHNVMAGILNWAFGYEVHEASGYGGRLSVQPGFHTDNAYRGIVSFGYGNEGDVDFTRVAALGPANPWTLGAVRGTPHPQSRYPGVRFFIRIPYYNDVTGRTSFIVRGFHTPHWFRDLPEAAAILAITQEDIIAALRDNPAQRFVCADAGDDANDGSANAPWRTINHALQQIWHGDVLFLSGTFEEHVIIAAQASGNVNNPTVLTPRLGHTATIRGDGQWAVTFDGADNFEIRGVAIENGAVLIQPNDRRALRNFQPNWWDLRGLGEVAAGTWGLGMMRDIALIGTGAEVVAEGFAGYAPLLNLRVD